jgi:NAD(P)-dependent dehydrogenase (short-subunit alcohol dehydrogenase family)
MSAYTPPIQQPLHSGFHATSTADEVMQGISLAGRTAIVTGAYSGLGRETARALVAAGARVIAPARDVPRARQELTSLDSVEVWPMDLLDPTSIDAFAQRFLAEGQPLHLLVLNAGIMALPTLEHDARGLELQFATNHIGHFQLTGRLWPALASAGAAGGARVVVVSSRGHRFSPVVFDDLHFERRPYERWAAYGQSKTANVLFALELDRRGQAQGVRAYAVHPGGIVDTNLAKHLSPDELRAVGAIDEQGRPVVDAAKGFKSVTQGAATQLWCATSPRLDGLGGLYCEDGDVAPLISASTGSDWHQVASRSQAGVFAHAVDPAAAQQLWTLSATLTGVPYP